jgi:hypothetical protein
MRQKGMRYPTHVSTYLDDELLEKLDTYSNAYDMTRAAALRALIRHGYSRYLEQPIHHLQEIHPCRMEETTHPTQENPQ